MEEKGVMIGFPLGTVKKAARFLCSCRGEFARMMEQDASHSLLAGSCEISLEASCCAIGERDGAILQSSGVGKCAIDERSCMAVPEPWS